MPAGTHFYLLTSQLAIVNQAEVMNTAQPAQAEQSSANELVIMDWEERHRAIRNFQVRLENIVPIQNNRLTTEWNCLWLAKAMLERGGWLQTDPFRFKLLNRKV